MCSSDLGAATEAEMKEKKARVEDALHATRAAVEEGIVPGGGVALIRAQHALKDVKTAERDEQIGVDIVRRAIEEPLRMIVQNAGGEGSIVVEKIRTAKEKNFGYNALTDTYEDLVQAGVIGSLKRQRWPGGQHDWPVALKDSRAWAYLTMKPGEDPVGALVSEIGRAHV